MLTFLLYPKLKLMIVPPPPPPTQFLIEGFTAPYRLDQNGLSVGILVYNREVIPSELIPSDFSNREGFFLELNLRKKKWVLCSYNPQSNFSETHMDSIEKDIDSLSARYENFILIGNFNAEESDTTTKDLCGIYSFRNLVKNATCFENPDSLKCIDLMLTNRNKNFQNSCVIDTGLFDFHKMTVTVLRSHLNKLAPKIIHYRDYKNFSNDAFRSDPAGNYMFKVNNRNNRKRREIRSTLTLKTSERRHGFVLVSLLLALNIFHTLF